MTNYMILKYRRQYPHFPDWGYAAFESGALQ